MNPLRRSASGIHIENGNNYAIYYPVVTLLDEEIWKNRHSLIDSSSKLTIIGKELHSLTICIFQVLLFP